jgi:rhodanese-related sulfurtransferase
MRKQMFIKKSLVVFFVLLFTLSLSSYCLAYMTEKDFVKEAKETITEISVADAKAAMDAGKVDVILDCRTAKEFKKGHLPKAMNLQRGLLEFKATKKIANKAALIVVYCKSGGRSSLSTKTLGQMGYTNVKSMDGGWKAWVKAGYPIE